jgi:hypothetical protein
MDGSRTGGEEDDEDRSSNAPTSTTSPQKRSPIKATQQFSEPEVEILPNEVQASSTGSTIKPINNGTWALGSIVRTLVEWLAFLSFIGLVYLMVTTISLNWSTVPNNAADPVLDAAVPAVIQHAVEVVQAAVQAVPEIVHQAHEAVFALQE